MRSSSWSAGAAVLVVGLQMSLTLLVAAVGAV
jgi:hypothetical protein